jgi:hypothetical protein
MSRACGIGLFLGVKPMWPMRWLNGSLGFVEDFSSIN